MPLPLESVKSSNLMFFLHVVVCAVVFLTWDVAEEGVGEYMRVFSLKVWFNQKIAFRVFVIVYYSMAAKGLNNFL
jgi:hypothetical protein